MRQRRGTGPDVPAAPADDRGLRRGVVRGAERRAADQRTARRQRPGDRVNGRDLQGRGRLQPRQDRGQPLGQHGFAHPGRPEQQQVVPARGGYLGGPPGRRLPDQVGQVAAGNVRVPAARAGRGGVRRQRAARQDRRPLGAVRRAAAAQPAEQRAQAGGGEHPDARDQGRLRPVVGGHDDGAEPGRHGRGDRRENAPDRAQPAVEAQFPDEQQAGQAGRGDDAGRAEDGDRDAGVEAAAALRQAGR